jgi:hypothetical protein
MKLSDYIKTHHNGVQSHFAAFHGIPASRVNELLKSDNTAFVFEYVSDDGEKVTSIFKEGRRLKGIINTTNNV